MERTSDAPKRVSLLEQAISDASATSTPKVVTQMSGSGKSEPAAWGKLIRINEAGQDAETYSLHHNHFDIGRYEGDLILNEDFYMSDRHARLSRHEQGAVLTDLDSVNGIYRRIRETHILQDRDFLLIGLGVFRFEKLSSVAFTGAKIGEVEVFGSEVVPCFARLVQYTKEGIGRDVFHLHREETLLGREEGHLVFQDDPYLSKTHARIRRKDGALLLDDLDSANGVLVRLRDRMTLKNHDIFRVGRQLFRFERVESEKDVCVGVTNG